MLVVRIELHSAVTGKVTELGIMHIANVTSDIEHLQSGGKIGHYRAMIFRAPKFVRWTRDSAVTHYRRLNRPVWDLVTLALKNAGYGR